jgi:large conductance mechanosensitive channel
MAEKKSLVQEFKEFLMKGNLVEIAVAFVMGAAFTTVVGSVTGDGSPEKPGIVGGILGAIFGGDQPNFGAKGPTINGSFIPIGGLVTALINFVMVGAVVFLVVKAYNKMRKAKDEAPAGPSEVDLLTEIRDSLKSR